MDYKYDFTGETIMVRGHRLYQIKALKNFSDVKAGDLGGWVESELNLSQEGDCWVYNNAKAYDESYVEDSAKIRDNAEVQGYSHIYENATVSENVKVTDFVEIKGNAVISGNANVWNNSIIEGDVTVKDHALISGNTRIFGNAKIGGNILLSGDINIGHDAIILKQSDVVQIQGVGEFIEKITFFRRTENLVGVMTDQYEGKR